MPPYFYFLTLLALRVFHAERVDVAVLEVGLGGRWDATNVVPAPAVCGITSLGYDHMDILGHTLTLIAGEKAGIMKSGVPAVTTEQPDEAAVVLRARAEELQVWRPSVRGVCAPATEPWRMQVPLQLAPSLESFERGDAPVQLGLAGAHQRLNAAMAVQLCRLWASRARPKSLSSAAHEQVSTAPLSSAGATHAASECMLRHAQLLAKSELPEPYALGLAQARWPGRAQVVLDSDSCAPTVERCSNLTFHLDGAHTGESAATCAEWFAGAAQAGEAAQAVPSERVLVFNCMKARWRRAGLRFWRRADKRGRSGARAETAADAADFWTAFARCAGDAGGAGFFRDAVSLTAGLTAHRRGLHARHLCACRPSWATG
jgi:folylpolyglutamate synthase